MGAGPQPVLIPAQQAMMQPVLREQIYMTSLPADDDDDILVPPALAMANMKKVATYGNGDYGPPQGVDPYSRQLPIRQDVYGGKNYDMNFILRKSNAYNGVA